MCFWFSHSSYGLHYLIGFSILVWFRIWRVAFALLSLAHICLLGKQYIVGSQLQYGIHYFHGFALYKWVYSLNMANALFTWGQSLKFLFGSHARDGFYISVMVSQ